VFALNMSNAAILPIKGFIVIGKANLLKATRYYIDQLLVAMATKN
jgi:hypothetical protein